MSILETLEFGVEWDPKKYPFEQIATLQFEPQDSWLPEFHVWWDDRIHGLKELEPLGSTIRMRRVVYDESRKLRLRVNGCKSYIEPANLEEVPAPIAAPHVAVFICSNRIKLPIADDSFPRGLGFWIA